MCCKPHLVKISEQPGLGGREGADAPKSVPDGECAPNKLVSSGRFHWVDAHVGATQPHGALRGCCARRIVFWHHQTMPAAAAWRLSSGSMGHSQPAITELPGRSVGSMHILTPPSSKALSGVLVRAGLYSGTTGQCLQQTMKRVLLCEETRALACQMPQTLSGNVSQCPMEVDY